MRSHNYGRTVVLAVRRTPNDRTESRTQISRFIKIINERVYFGERSHHAVWRCGSDCSRRAFTMLFVKRTSPDELCSFSGAAWDSFGANDFGRTACTADFVE